MIYIFISEALILGLTYVVADIHAHHYDDNKPIGWLWHALWFLPFAVFTAGTWLVTKNWQETTAIFLVRGLFFNPILNFLRRKINAAGFLNRFFYVNSKSAHAAFWDAPVEAMGRLYPVLWVVILGFFIYLQFHL